MEVVFSIFLAVLFTLLLTPFVRQLAFKIGAVDAPDPRKVHKVVMPRMGGLAIFLSFWTTVLLTRPEIPGMTGFFVGSLLIVISGIWDDMKGLKPVYKILFQLAAAAVVIAGGVKVTFVTSLVSEGPFALGIFSLPITLLWIIGMTNAINLVDGLDGLAAGISGIAAVSIGLISWIEGLASVGILALLLGASTLAFLKYNFNPARIFMGDTGALFLGFALSVLSIMGLTKMATTVSLFLPVVILGVPIMDTLFAIIRRKANKQPIFVADKDHLHHRLLALGLSHKGAVLTVYAVCVFLSISAIGMALVANEKAMVIMVAVAVIVFYGAERVGIIGKRAQKALVRQARSSAIKE